ncbi:MAG: hypothetical protein Q4B94_05055 [Pseudomonadota bacterium]|nr:hypothetical protein [Pseudomonadota bacterium]
MDKTRITAWWVALSVNALFVFYLLTAHRQVRVSAAPAPSQSRVQLYFISPPKPPVVAVQSAPQVPPQIREERKSTAAKALTVAEAAASAPASGSPASDMRDDWFVAGASPAQASARPAEDFVRNPLQRQPMRMEATRARMRLEFRDSSLASMSQAGICKELRAQLGSNPASASAILASMRRHGCIKSAD